MDLMKIEDILIAKIKRDYADDVSIMCVCGSYVYQDTYEKSDLDFYIIPKTRRGYEMARTFIIDDIGFDLWALSWKRAEDIAHYRERNVAIIADARVVYYSSAEDLAKFEKLRAIARQPEGIVDFNTRIKELMNENYGLYFSMLENRDDFSNVKLNAIQLLLTLVEAIAVSNHTYIKRSWGHILDEVLAMKNVPENFESLFKDIIYADESEVIISKTSEIVQSAQNTVLKPDTKPVDIQETFKMFFEEIKSTYNKLYHACDTGDTLAAIMAGAAIQTEIIQCIGTQAYKQAGLIDIVSRFSKNDLQGFKNTVKKHENQFENYLINNNVPIYKYDTIDEFENEIKEPKD